jgi:plasmid stabilization system protein ParE
VLAYSELNWGKAQRGEYERLIARTVDQIVRFPSLGRLRPEYGPNIRGLLVRQHVILYQTTDAEITIVRVLHMRREATGEFEDGPN